MKLIDMEAARAKAAQETMEGEEKQLPPKTGEVFMNYVQAVGLTEGDKDDIILIHRDEEGIAVIFSTMLPDALCFELEAAKLRVLQTYA